MSQTISEITIINDFVLSEISNHIKCQNFDNFNSDKILKMSETNILLFITVLINHICNNNYYKYKYAHYENTVKLIINIILRSFNMKKYIDLTFNDFTILKVISSVINSQIYLKKIKKIIEINKYYNINLLIHVVKKSTMLVFLFWWDSFFKNIILSVEHYILLLSNSIINPDDRIYQYILDQNNVNFLEKIYTSENVCSIINTLFLSHIPKKFILKRLKLLSSKTDLSKILNNIIKYTYDIRIHKKLLTYYYNCELTFDILMHIVTESKTENKFDFCSAIEIYKILKTENEKNIFALLCNLNSYYHEKIIIVNINKKILDENIKYILPQLVIQFDMIYKNDLYTRGLYKIFNYYKLNNIIEQYLLKVVNNFEIVNLTELIKYTKFFVLPNDNSQFLYLYMNKNIKINKILHLLRCLLKKYSNNKYNKFNYKFKPVINEIINFKPNNQVKILKNGSLNYQLVCQKYNKIPPRHILPLENIINKNYLIKEKPDGILTFILPPNNITPFVSEIYNYEIKAEFIEKLNLYLVFDINIPNLNIIERQYYLRSLHPDTRNISYIPVINDFTNLLIEIKKERVTLKKFIDNNNNLNFKWYPKCSWEIYLNDHIYKNLINVIEEKSELNDILLNGEFNYDGLILTPLDGKRELKIKPKKLQTIDLLYNGKKWLDSDNCEWDIDMLVNKNYQNKIYRCYPNDNKYIAVEIRYDKQKPNSNKIIDQIQNIYKFNWNKNIDLLINKQKYYEEVTTIYNNNLINILNNQKNLLINVIKEFFPEINKNWLDLGCGKCRLYYQIKDKYLPKKYLAIDNDINILSTKYHLIDEYSNIINIYPCNLNDKWDEITLWNSFNWSIKYNYIIANFSIMHFFSDLFWNQLNKITNKGSIFIFNVVKKDIHWSYNNSYIISNNIETKIYFEWTHVKEHIEKLISEEMINDTINKYNWKINNKINFNKQLSNCYDWYILEKI